MTTLIAHRGNLNGPDPSRENHPYYIEQAIEKGYDVEIDLRMYNGILHLGHDESQYDIDLSFLMKHQGKLWVHCKDNEAFHFVNKYTRLNYFWHDTDDYTMTSYGFVWAYPGKPPVGDRCVMVMPERHWTVAEMVKFKTYSICSDYVEQIKNYK
jgi:hypothetical protein